MVRSNVPSMTGKAIVLEKKIQPKNVLTKYEKPRVNKILNQYITKIANGVLKVA